METKKNMMDRYVLSLESREAGISSLCGNKTAALSVLINSGISVPPGFCVTSEAYRKFIQYNGLEGVIVMETARKPLEEMRWEEMWDASLRIRSAFLKSEVPDDILAALENKMGDWLRDKGLAVRSSSLLEDTAGGSFAGLHESVINVRGFEDFVEALVSVWASLWSDAVFSYAKELGIEEKDSSMAVVVQEMIEGERSGVAFGRNPNNSNQSVIEAVFGLNKGMVDGEVQPDRWVLDRQTGGLITLERAEHNRRVVAARSGVRFEQIDIEEAAMLPLSEEEVQEIFRTVLQVEEIFGSAQDVEWTIRGDSLFLLQSRPITTGDILEGDDRRAFDLSLRKSFETLRKMSDRIENDIVPEMISEADELFDTDLSNPGDSEIADEISSRNTLYSKWEKIYWDEFIPFAHGVRLFGRVYNDRLKPDDPYEFVDLLSVSETLSVKRNRMLEELAGELKEIPGLRDKELEDLGGGINERLEEFIGKFGKLSCEGGKCDDEKKSLLGLIRELAISGRPDRKTRKRLKDKKKRERLEDKFLESFPEEEKGFASELLDIARHSYRLRDDDNIYLGRFERALNLAVDEARRRLGDRCRDFAACRDAKEIERALRDPDYVPNVDSAADEDKRDKAVTARQLRGQPAGEGIARGTARVIESAEDLFNVRDGEILVCDSIDPNMTFVIPLVSGIVERRGGMLVHGAIIAREYGLPCVTGVANATGAVRTGDRLTVDGYDGLVIIHRD
ncbi:MAG TPA: PEP/pyruvate-binding domain-containing protein [Candidatus Krumholzibacteriaceae bacterium]|nr:PEP/pyruvate-binding domain-containing protein [Candidatus Krumholzibacteriaceae bacterium]